ncbi:MFS transporter [Caballeronia sp. DA-9]|uniref:MFS transporter n=1 Tax=Caballeronia sp. DA-9 TaxID=3436237 RepID=UPI003F67F55E
MTNRPATSRYRYAIFTSVFVLALINYIDRGALGFASTSIIDEYGFDKSTWGTILGYFGYGYMFGALIGGFVVDRIGAKRLWIVAGVAWSIFEMLTAWAGDFGLTFLGGSAIAGFAAVRIIFGLTEGPAYSVINKTMSRWAPKRERGSAVALAMLSSPLGAMLTAPVSVGLLLLSGSWRTTFVVLGIVSLAALLVIMRFFTSRPEEHSRVSAAELAMIQEGAEDGRIDANALAASNDAWPWWYFFRTPTLIFNALGYFAYVYVTFLLVTWTPKYLHDQFHFDLQSLWYVGMIPWLGACVSVVFGGRLSDLILRRTGNFFLARSCVAAGSLFMAGLSFWLMNQVTTAAAVIALMALANAFSALPNSVYWAVVIDSTPAERVGTVSGITHCIANTGSIIAPTLAGVLATKYGYPAIFTGASVVAGLAMCSMLLVRPGRSARQLAVV